MIITLFEHLLGYTITLMMGEYSKIRIECWPNLVFIWYLIKFL